MIGASQDLKLLIALLWSLVYIVICKDLLFENMGADLEVSCWILLWGNVYHISSILDGNGYSYIG